MPEIHTQISVCKKGIPMKHINEPGIVKLKVQLCDKSNGVSIRNMEK